MMEIGNFAECCVTVNENNTAIALGSGDLEVFATPAMIALMEGAAMKCVATDLPEGSTTVGTAMNSSHIKASAIGSEIVARAELVEIDNRKLTFKVTAYQGSDLIGEGVHTRFVVDRVKFMQKIGA